MSIPQLGQRDLENHDAVAFVIRDRAGNVLTLFHEKFSFWTLPLGKAEPGQTPEEAVAAEALEECGVVVTKMQKRCLGTKVYHYPEASVLTFFHIFEILDYEGTPVNREPLKHPEMRFMSLPELFALTVTSDGTEMWLEYIRACERSEQTQPPEQRSSLLPAAVRISLSGAAGAGKTTFARYLEANHGARIHTESVRTWLTSMGNLEYSGLTEVQISDLQLHLMDRYEHSTANVFDRSPLDSLVYARRVSHLLDYVAFQARAMALLRGFHVIVFFPPFPPYLKPDGVRIANLDHQMSMAADIHVEARRLGLGHMIMVYDHSKAMRFSAQSILARLPRQLAKLSHQ